MAGDESFKAWFKQRRKGLDLTQEELACLAGCSIYTVQRIEEGVLRPSRQLGELLAAGLAIPAEERAAFVRWARTGAPPAEQAAPGAPHPAGSPSGPPPPTPGELINPYKGLRAFQEADAPDFFGRAGLIQQLRARLAEDGALARFLAVVGPSGSGKSSVVRAGLVPALRRQPLPASTGWRVAQLIPGARPLEELEAALLRVAANPPPSLLEQLRADERGLARAVKRVLPDDHGTELLLVIDQFEELFTLVADEQVRQDFIDSLFRAIADADSRLRVVITLRADFYDRPLLYLPSSELLDRRTAVVGPLTAEEVYQAITGPAERVGLEFERSLVATIMQDLGEQPGTLPLLQYTLTELYERREGARLTLAAYRASGGIFGSLGQRAESLYAGLTAAEQGAARQLFLRLVALGAGGEETRRRVPLSELVSAARDEAALHRALAGFGHYRMLTFDRDPATGEPLVEVAHEALLHGWARLRAWLTESREGLLVERRLMAAAAEWGAAGHDPSFLVGGTRLAQFAGLAAADAAPSGHLGLTDEEQAYVAVSLAEQQRQQAAEQTRQTRELALQKRAANRLRTLAAVLALFFLVASGLALLAAARQQTAQANLTRSEALRLAAEASKLIQQGGPAELAGLLSVRAIRTQYSPQGDAALEAASRLDYPVRRLAAGSGSVWVLAFSPDSRRLLSSDHDTVWLWDVASGAVLAHAAIPANYLAYAPDGRHFVTAGAAAGTLAIWDSTTLTSTAVLSTGVPVRRVIYSPDGHYVLTSHNDQTARVWDVATGRQRQVFQVGSKLTDGLAWSPDGQSVVTGDQNNRARLWDVQTGRLVREFNIGLAPGAGTGPTVIAISPDGTTLVTNGPRTPLLLWDVATGVQRRELVGHSGPVWGATFALDGKTLLTSSGDGTARLWDSTTGRQLRVLRGSGGLTEGRVGAGAAFAPDGRWAATGYTDGTVLLWDATRSAGLPVFTGHTGAVHIVAFSPDGQTVLTASDSDRTARLWDAATGRPVPPLLPGPAGSSMNSAAFSPDGRYVLTANGRPANRAYLWDRRSGAEVRVFPVNALVDRAIFSPDGRTVLTGSSDGMARLWDTATGALLHVLKGHSRFVSGLAYAPNGATVLTSGADQTARLWDVRTGAELHRFLGHTNIVDGLAYAPDGQRVLTGSDDGTARLWDVQTGAVLGTFMAQGNGIKAVAFAPDGQRILAGDVGGVAHLWDISGELTSATWGRELRRLTGHQGAIFDVAFAHDGRQVLTGSDDGTAQLWYTDYQDTLRALCGQLIRDLTPEERTQYGIADPGPTCPKP